MNRLALIAVTGFLALALTGCGESGNKSTTTQSTTSETKNPNGSDTTTTTTTAPQSGQHQ